jgi:NRPS condensation-like uncharacterized protein
MSDQSNPIASPILRPLGLAEALWWRINQACSSTFLMVAQIQGKVDLARLQTALNHVATLHPILQANIQLINRQPYLFKTICPTIPLNVIARQDAKHWQQVAQAALDVPFSSQDPLLWRVIAVHDEQHTTLMIVFDHSISDAKSGLVIIEQVLQHHEGLLQAEPQPLKGAYEHRLPARTLWQRLPHHTQQALRMLKPIPAADFAQTSDQALHTRLAIHQVHPAQTKALVQLCRAHQTTMQGLLGALYVRAAHRLVADPSLPIKLGSSVSVRAMLQDAVPKGQTDHEVGFMAFGVESLHNNNTDVWALAREVNQQIAAQMQPDHVYFGLWLRKILFHITPTPDKLLQTLTKSAKSVIHLTNIGNTGLAAQYGSLHLQHCFHLPPVRHYHKPVFCMTVSSHQGTLQLNLAWAEPVTAPSLAQALMQDIQLGIQTLLSCAPVSPVEIV